MIRTKTFLTVLISLCILHGYGQNLKGNVGPDDSHHPNASKGESGTGLLNVDLFTGTGSMNIPIYNYSTVGLDLGVSLTYSLKGIRIDELAGSAGLGFNINAGGYIARDVNGLEDEVTLPIYFLYNDTSITAHDSLQGSLVPGAKVGSPLDTDADDNEADVFHLVFGGRSVDFTLKWDNSTNNMTAYTSPRSELQVNVYTTDISVSGTDSNTTYGVRKHCGIEKNKDVMVFRIKDEKGNWFYFERGDYEYKDYNFASGTFNSNSGSYYSTRTWNLAKVVTYEGITINYQYASKYVDYVENVTETIYSRLEYDAQGNNTDPMEIKNWHFKGIKTHPSKISYPNGTDVIFDLDTTRVDCPGNYRLKNIFVQNDWSAAQMFSKITYQLNQAYFNTPMWSNSATEVALASASTISLTIPSRYNHDSVVNMHKTRGMRLKLNSIDRIGSDNTTTEKYYSFTYNATPLPYRFAPSKDYYGYYNNETPWPHIRDNFTSLTVNRDTFYTSIPWHYEKTGTDKEAYSSSITVYTYDGRWGAKRAHDFTYAQACVLTGIKNCGGGKDSIIYQPYHLTNPYCSYGNRVGYVFNHYYNLDVSVNIGCSTTDSLLVGDTCNDGLIVGKIISTDGYHLDNNRSVEYTYDTAVRFNLGGYMSYANWEGKNTYTNFFITPDKYVNGSNHGFSQVTVTNKGYAGQVLSKSVHNFSNLIFNSGSSDSSCIRRVTGDYFHTMPANFLTYRMGLPLRVRSYDGSNNLMSDVVNTFEYSGHTPASLISRKTFRQGVEESHWDYETLNFEMMRLTSVTKTDYAGSQVTATTTNYSYDINDNPTTISYEDSRGDTYHRYIKYNYDYYNSFSYLPDIFWDMDNKKQQFPFSTETWRLNGSGDSDLTDLTMTSAISDYPGGPNITTLFPVRFNAKMANPLSSSQAASTSVLNRNNAIDFTNNTSYGSALLKERECLKYDSKANCLETRINNEELYESAIWDTMCDRKLAEASNARYDEIAFTSFEGVHYNALGVSDYNKGNWDFDPSFIMNYIAVTGNHTYRLIHDSSYVHSKPLSHKKYFLSFWAGYPPYLNPVSVSLHTGGALTLTKQNILGPYVLMTATFTPDSGDYLEITETSQSFYTPVLLDEMRLCPSDAVMTTYTQSPFGPMSITSPTNVITRYGYDAFGREANIRTIENNTIKVIQRECNASPPSGGTAGGATGWGLGVGSSSSSSSSSY